MPSSFRHIVLTILLAIFATANALAATNWTPSDNDLRILEVRVGQYRIDDSLAAYQHKNEILIPLGALADDLEIAIDVQPNLAKGFIFKKDNTFFLDLSTHQVTIKGVLSRYPDDEVFFIDGDIYVESRLLSKWLGINLDLDLFSSTLRVRSKTPLPFQLKMEREKRIARTLASLHRSQEQYPRLYEPYANISTPFIDQTVQGTLTHSSSGTSKNISYTTYASADVLKQEASLYVNGRNGDSVHKVRARIGRYDPESELLGPLKATEYGLGNVTEPRVDLITIPGDQQVGAVVSNQPLTQQAEFDRHRFRGDLPPGWSVELYRNNQLIAYQQTAVNGQYDFPNIPLLLGTNYFRLVFYGPRGETREEDQQFELGQSLTRPGKEYYRALMTKGANGGTRTVMQYNAGLSKQYSGSFDYISIPLQNGTTLQQHRYAKAGLQGFWQNYFMTFDLLKDENGGSATEFSAQTRISTTVFGLKTAQLNNFFSEEFTLNSAQARQRTSFSINTAIPQGWLPRIPVSFKYTTEKYTNNTEINQLVNLISTYARGIAVTNQLTSTSTTGAVTQTSGSLQLSQRIANYGLRGTLNYNIKPNSELSDLNLTLDTPPIADYNMSYGLTQSFIQHQSLVSVKATKPIGKYSLSIGGSYSTNHDFSVDALFSISLGREPRSDRWYTNAQSTATHGSVSARVFVDSNQDGIYEKGEQVIPNVRFKVNNGYNPTVTDKNGIAFITGLPEHQPVNLVLEQGTLVDPSMTPAIDGVRIIPRPGKTIKIDFPIELNGEIDGTVHVLVNGKSIGAGRVDIELVDAQGRIIKTAKTAYDGYYDIANIPPGTYRVRVAASQLSKLGLHAKYPEGFTINTNNLYIDGLDISLK